MDNNGQTYNDGGWDWSGLVNPETGEIESVTPIVKVSHEEQKQSDKYNAYLLLQAQQFSDEANAIAWKKHGCQTSLMFAALCLMVIATIAAIIFGIFLLGIG